MTKGGDQRELRSAPGPTQDQRAVSVEDRLSLLIGRLLASMDTAAAEGGWDRVVELANDVLAVDPPNQRARSMIERANLERAAPADQRAFVSLIFADMVQSTPMAETAEPEVVLDVFALYRRVAVEIIEALGGRVLQFQGDGVVACFGYPIAHEDDARRAVLAGLRLVERMADVAAETSRRHDICPAIRVGVHSGTVVVAGLAQGVLDGSAIVGSAPNVTARLQGEAEPGTVVISDTTRQLVEGHFELASEGTHRLKGIARPMELHRIVGLHPADPSAQGLPEPVTLVGREHQRRLLHFTWERAAARRAAGAMRPEPSVVLVRGVAGIGKSALAAELAAHVLGEGGAVLEANCSPDHGNVALWPIGRMLEQVLGFYPGQPSDERVGEVAARLADAGLGSDVVGWLAPVLGLDTDERWSRPEVDALALRQQTLRTLVAWLARAAASTPTLVLVEDLHWADPTTLELLGLLVTERVPGTMLVLTSRMPLDAPWTSSVVDIELEPLRANDAAGLVAALTDSLDETQIRLVLERGAGIPLFLRELTRGALTATRDEMLPPRIHEMLTARLRAPGIDLRVAQLAAALGSEFDVELLAELAERPVHEALHRLEDAALIEPVAAGRLGRFRFRHGLLRDAVYETQVLPTRQTTHHRIAELLGSTATSPGALAIVAHHFDLAGDVTRSIPSYTTAAQAAQAAASHTEARRLLDRALELASATPQSDERDLTDLLIRMQRTVSTISLYGYGYPDVYEDYSVAQDICQRLTNRPEIMPAQVGIWSYLFVSGSVAAASRVLEPLTDVLDQPSTTWFAPEIKSCMGFYAFYEGRLEDASRWLVEAWEGYHARSVDAASSPLWPLPHDPVPVTAVALACVAALRGSTKESAVWERRAFEKTEDLAFPSGPYSVAFVTVYLAWIRMITGHLEDAREFGRRTIEVGERYGFDYFKWLGGQYKLAPEPGRPCGVDELDAYGSAMDAIGHRAFRATYLGIVAQNHHYRGDTDLAFTAIEEALDETRTSGELVHQPDLLRLRAEITADTHPDRMAEVAALLVAATEIGRAQGSLVLALRAANDLARVPDDARPPDWSDRVRSVLERFPPNSSSPELADARELLGA